jgi:regulator of protease activity HflC (stomatin/prohibitin superfamily)
MISPDITEEIMIREREYAAPSGWLILVVLLVAMPLTLLAVPVAVGQGAPWLAVAAMFPFAVEVVCLGGFFVVNPNEGRVLQLFGSYRGTVRTAGLRWASPFYSKRTISLRVRNFESGRLKVNDNDGNPIEIAAVVVWKVVDSAEAFFEVDDYANYMKVQTEAALRNLATRYPYDGHLEDEVSLRGNTAAVAAELQKEIQDRLSRAGVQALEARISHLAYAPEIAASMLRRQQAGAVVAARQKIVEGAVGMVEMALDLLTKSNMVTLDEDRKAAMVSNLLVVLCGERDPQPVVNTGTIYQ